MAVYSVCDFGRRQLANMPTVLASLCVIVSSRHFRMTTVLNDIRLMSTHAKVVVAQVRQQTNNID
jgi:hypothetical protein